MNYKSLRLTGFLSVVILLLTMGSCVKERAGFTDLTQTSDLVVLQNAGLGNFSATAFNRTSDTIRLTVRADLASVANPSAPVTVNIKLDNDAITGYNAANPLPGYVPFPAAKVKLLSNTLTIPAGEHYAQTTLEIYTSGLDPAVAYMAPISIVDASGKGLSANLNTVYFHTIGNPLAGSYKYDFYRWNNTSDTTGAPNGGTSSTTESISPAGPTVLLFPESYLNVFVDPAPLINLSFTDNAGTFSNFSGFLTDATKNKITDPNGVFGGSIITSTVLVGYQIVGNASTKYKGSKFRFYTSIKNSTGGIRTFIDNFEKL